MSDQTIRQHAEATVLSVNDFLANGDQQALMDALAYQQAIIDALDEARRFRPIGDDWTSLPPTDMRLVYDPPRKENTNE